MPRRENSHVATLKDPGEQMRFAIVLSQNRESHEGHGEFLDEEFHFLPYGMVRYRYSTVDSDYLYGAVSQHSTVGYRYSTVDLNKSDETRRS